MCMHMTGLPIGQCAACKGFANASKGGFVPRMDNPDYPDLKPNLDPRMRECASEGGLRGSYKPKSKWARSVTVDRKQVAQELLLATDSRRIRELLRIM